EIPQRAGQPQGHAGDRRRAAPMATALRHGAGRRRSAGGGHRRRRRPARCHHPHPPRRGPQLGPRRHTIRSHPPGHPVTTGRSPLMSRERIAPDPRRGIVLIRMTGAAGAVLAAVVVWLLARYGAGMQLRTPGFTATGYPTVLTAGVVVVVAAVASLAGWGV